MFHFRASNIGRLLTRCALLENIRYSECAGRHFYGTHEGNLQSLSIIKQLRKATKGGVAQCKEALVKSNWDLDAAIAYIRQIQQSNNEIIDTDKPVYGKIALPSDILTSKDSVIVELNCNCDFITSSDEFAKESQQIRESIQKYVSTKHIMDESHASASLMVLNADTCKGVILDQQENITVGELLSRLSGEYKRAIELSSAIVFSPNLESSYPGVYVHKKRVIHNGIIGERLAIINMKCKQDIRNSNGTVTEVLGNIAKSIAIQLAANPFMAAKTSDDMTLDDEHNGIQEFLKQSWLQGENIVENVNRICYATGAAKPIIGPDTTIEHTLHTVALILGLESISVEVALYMKPGERMVLMRSK